MRRPHWQLSGALAVCLIGLASGCANKPGNIDPYEKVNRFFYNFNESLDRRALKPAADAYVKAIPRPIRTGLGNAFDNLGYLNVVANDFLQAKWDQGLSDTGRFAVNSTVGIAGIFDVASGWGMPAHENRFGTTLGKWGFGPGPYLVLPLLGPSSVRDVPGIGVAMVTNPLFWVGPPWYVSIPLSVTAAIDARSRNDFIFRFRNDAALDPYVFTRNAYLQYRQAEIRGAAKPADEGLYDDDPAGSTSLPTTRKSR